MAVAGVRDEAEGDALGDQHVVARLIRERAELGDEPAGSPVDEIQQVAVGVAVGVRHRSAAPADRDADIGVRQHHLRHAARIGHVGRLDARSVGDAARVQRTFDAHDLVGAVPAVDHCDRAEEALAADVLFAQVAEADARLADVAALGVMDPGTHGSGLLPSGMARWMAGNGGALDARQDWRREATNRLIRSAGSFLCRQLRLWRGARTSGPCSHTDPVGGLGGHLGRDPRQDVLEPWLRMWCSTPRRRDATPRAAAAGRSSRRTADRVHPGPPSDPPELEFASLNSHPSSMRTG